MRLEHWDLFRISDFGLRISISGGRDAAEMRPVPTGLAAKPAFVTAALWMRKNPALSTEGRVDLYASSFLISQ